MVKETLLSGLKNWQTTALGGLGGAAHLITNVNTLSSGSAADKANVILMAIGMFLVGLFSKDADKTGVLGKKE